MNNLRAAAVGLGLADLLIPRSGHSQIPTFQSQAEVASSLQPVPVDSIPEFGTFFLLSGQLDESLPSIPLPYDLYHGTEPVYALDSENSVFLIADSPEDYAALMEAYFNGRNRSLVNGRLMSLSDTGMDEESLLVSNSFSTNDLWLEITAFTNNTAALVIHRPWNDTNVAHDLFYTANLSSPEGWNFRLRCVSTNVLVPDLCGPQGFFRLGQTNGNLTVTTNATPLQLAQLLVPPWVTIANATYTGAVAARGTFAGGNGCGLPIDSGVILSSGPITNALGPNNDSGFTARTNLSSDLGQPNDSDLDGLVGGGPTHDAAVLEFDIISTNSFTLQFRYIFASEEYPEYISTSGGYNYNDPMAIFVSTNRVGTNWNNSITNDIALVPGTTNVPISVNTINGGGYSLVDLTVDPASNPQFYRDNHDPDNSPLPAYAARAQVFNIQYDGTTVLLMAQKLISAGVTNHVKIAIADYNDAYYDSAVFITAQTPCP